MRPKESPCVRWPFRTGGKESSRRPGWVKIGPWAVRTRSKESREPMTTNPFDDGSEPLRSRRQVLQLGGIGALGLTLPALLQAEDLERKAQGKSGQAKSCIFIYQYGGLSQLDSWDMKPNAPHEIRGPYEPIATATPGFQVCELMPRLARLSEQYAVIRSMTHKMSQHDKANAMLLAGRDKPAADDPSFGSVVTKLRPSDPSLPGHVWLQKFGGGAAPPDHTYLTGGRLGMAYAPMLIGERHDDNPGRARFPRSRVRNQQGGVAGAIAGAAPTVARSAKPVTRGRHVRIRGARLISTQVFRVAARPGGQVGIRYQSGERKHQGSLRQESTGAELASRAAPDRVGCPPGERRRLDRTGGGREICQCGNLGHAWQCGRRHLRKTAGTGFPSPCLAPIRPWRPCWRTFATEDCWIQHSWCLSASSAGRRPSARAPKRMGRDHWPQCYSAMLAGAGVRGGVVYGESDQRAAYVKSNPVTLEDFTATLFTALRINPASRLNPDGFTTPASSGDPIHPLFA